MIGLGATLRPAEWIHSSEDSSQLPQSLVEMGKCSVVLL